jgi:hypothetical protein
VIWLYVIAVWLVAAVVVGLVFAFVFKRLPNG